MLLGHSFLPSLCLVCFKYGFCLSLCLHVFLILWHPMERERKNIPWREKIKSKKLRESSKQENAKIAHLSYVGSLRWSSSTAFLPPCFLFFFFVLLWGGHVETWERAGHRRYFYKISFPFIFVFFLYYHRRDLIDRRIIFECLCMFFFK